MTCLIVQFYSHLGEEAENNTSKPKHSGHVKNKERVERRKKRKEAKAKEMEEQLVHMSNMTEDEIIEEMVRDKAPVPTNQSLFCSHESEDYEAYKIYLF